MGWGINIIIIGIKKHFIKNRKKYIKYFLKSLINNIKKLSPRVIKWWNGKNIAIIGPTSSGKSTLYQRLKNEDIPKTHISTEGLNKVGKFTFKMPLGNGKEFKIKCKRALDVGGDKLQRERYWLDACKDANVIFYIIDIRKMVKSSYSRNTRIYTDMKWLAMNIKNFNKKVVVHILANKTDLLVKHESDLEMTLSKHKEKLEKCEKIANDLFAAYKPRLTGLTAISLKDDYIFSTYFPKALEAVYKAVHE